jgi:ribonuclease HI
MEHIMSQKEIYTLYFDGGCMGGNPGGTAIGSWVVYDKDNKIFFEGSKVECKGKSATNNIAEFSGLMYGLEALKEKTGGNCILHIKGDSQLVINQINGIYQVRKDTLKPYHARCLETLRSFDIWKATHVKRDLNEYADKIGEEHYNRLINES